MKVHDFADFQTKSVYNRLATANKEKKQHERVKQPKISTKKNKKFEKKQQFNRKL